MACIYLLLFLFVFLTFKNFQLIANYCEDWKEVYGGKWRNCFFKLWLPLSTPLKTRASQRLNHVDFFFTLASKLQLTSQAFHQHWSFWHLTSHLLPLGISQLVTPSCHKVPVLLIVILLPAAVSQLVTPSCHKVPLLLNVIFLPAILLCWEGVA